MNTSNQLVFRPALTTVCSDCICLKLDAKPSHSRQAFASAHTPIFYRPFIRMNWRKSFFTCCRKPVSVDWTENRVASMWCRLVLNWKLAGIVLKCSAKVQNDWQTFKSQKFDKFGLRRASFPLASCKFGGSRGTKWRCRLESGSWQA